MSAVAGANKSSQQSHPDVVSLQHRDVSNAAAAADEEEDDDDDVFVLPPTSSSSGSATAAAGSCGVAALGLQRQAISLTEPVTVIDTAEPSTPTSKVLDLLNDECLSSGKMHTKLYLAMLNLMFLTIAVVT